MTRRIPLAAACRAGQSVAAAMSPFLAPVTPVRYIDTDTVRAITNPSFLTAGAGWTLTIGTAPTYQSGNWVDTLQDSADSASDLDIALRKMLDGA